MVDPRHAVPVLGDSSELDSHVVAICRFDQQAVAEKYPAQFGDGWRDRREVRSIRRALAGVPRGSHVLDLPCGAGRLLDILASCGYRVTCADCSEHMTRMARRRWEAIRSKVPRDASEPDFAVRDVMHTGYPDRHFDAIVCNRLFHHFRESEVRIRALTELRRISRGPVIVSFFNAFALGAVRFRLKHAVRRTVPIDRVPIPAWSFLNDVRRAGLTPVSLHAVTWGISPLWYVVSLPAAGRTPGTLSRGPVREIRGEVRSGRSLRAGHSTKPAFGEHGMQIAFLSTRAAKPSFRFRVERMLPYFAARGHRCETFFLARQLWRRLSLYRKLARYDAVFLQKRLLSRPELMLLRRCVQTLIYDLDDAVMYEGSGAEDRRRQARFAAMMRAADLVICGNQFLADEAARETDRLTIVPTSIDTDDYHPRLRKSDGSKVTVGWTGSRSTNPYLNDLLPILARQHGPIGVKIISETLAGIDFSVLGSVPRVFIPWSPAVEITEAATFDIGIMPVPDNRFTQGKCGFKALQYMALGIPAVCSPVGVNRDIIHDGLDGCLPRTRDEWFQTIARLVKDPFLRDTIGHAGRRRVEGAFSLALHGPLLVQAVEKARRPLRKSA